MEQRHLRQFVAVAEEHCFSRAARRLDITQPALSRQIRRLEEELGVQLFRRTKIRAELTEAGAVFLDEVQRGLVQMDRAVAAARRVGTGEVGHLAIGFAGPTAYSLLPPVVRLFRERHPKVDLDLDELTTGRQLDTLPEGTIQVGLLYPEGSVPELTMETVLSEPVVVALPRTHVLAGEARIHLADLASEPLLVCRREQEPALYDQYLGLCAGSGITPTVLDGANAMHLTIGLVGEGLGFALFPASARKVRHPDVVFRGLVPPPPRVGLAAAWRADELSPVLPLFLDVVREVAVQAGCRTEAATEDRTYPERAVPGGVTPAGSESRDYAVAGSRQNGVDRG